MLITDNNLELLPWSSNMGPSINPVNADAIISDTLADALEVTISSSKAYGGGLVSLNRPVPIVNGTPLPYFGIDWRVKPSDAAARFNRCYELDAKICFPAAPNSSTQIQNVYDLSTQQNEAEGGMEQIDDSSYKWVDTGYKPAPFIAGVWTPYKVLYKVDYSAKTSSVLYLQVGADSPFLVAPNQQGIPAQTTNWAWYIGGTPYPLVKFQIQLDDNDIPAGYQVDYQVTAYWSDQPIS